MATVNEVSSNLLPIDLLTPDTLPGSSAAKNSILNPLSSSNSQNIGGSALIDSKTQPVIEADKLSSPTDTLNSKNAIAEPNSKKSDDSLIVSDTLKSGLSASASSSLRDTLSGSHSGTDVKDTLTGSSKDAPLSAIKDDTITATDSLINPQNAEKVASDKTSGTLAEKESKPESAIDQNTSVSENKETASSEPIKFDNSVVKKSVDLVADTSKNSNQEPSPANSTEKNKQATDNTEVATVATPKELSLTVARSELVADNSFTSGKFVVDSTGQVGIDFLFDGGLYKGQLAIVSLKGMEKFAPGSEEFLKEVAARALSSSTKGHVVINDLSEGAKFTGNLAEGNYNDGSYLGVKIFAMTPGEEFGVMLVPNGTVQEVLNNPAIGGDKRPLFSMVTANPAEGFHVGQIADVTGSGKTFTMEDMRVDLGSDRDYNDFVFQVRGATGQAMNLDSVISADRDWRKTDMGQALIAYSKPYTEPKLEPAKEDVKAANNTDSNSVLDVPIPDKPITATEEIKPISNPATTKDEVVSETKLTPTEEETKESIAPISAAESVVKTEVKTSEPTVATAEKVAETKESIVPVSPPTESVSKTEGSETGFFSTNTSSQPTDSVKNPVSLVAAHQPSSETTVALAVKIEEQKESIAPNSPAAEPVVKTEVKTLDSTVTTAEKVTETQESISPNSPAVEPVVKTEVKSSESTVPTAEKVAEIKESISPISPTTESVSKTEGSETGFFSTNTSSQPTDSVKNPVSLVAAHQPSSETTVALAVKIEEQKESIALISTNLEININKNATPSKTQETASTLNDKPPAIKPVADFALTPAQPTRTIDLSQVFVDPEAGTLKYEVVEGNSASLAVSLEGNNLQLTGLPQSGVTDVVIRATDVAGNSVIHNFAVTNSNLSTESITAVNNALTDFTEVINQNSQSFSEALSTDAAAESLESLATLLEQYPDALSLFNKPDSLAKLGISDSNLPTIRQLLQSPEVAAEFWLSVSLGEALSQPDSADFDEFSLNADEAIYLLPSDAKQPKIGFIDFTEGQHVQRVTSAFASINSLAKYDTFTVNGRDWAEQLMRFVDEVKAKGENRAIANLSFDLSQLDDIGITTRYELTPEEQAAIQYARENNVLLVVSAGNTGGMMSALGQASKQFDNIITVGAIDRFESKTDYSAYGEGLNLMAPGGSWANDANAFVGTSRSASYVTAAASLVWAANPALSLTQVKKLLIDTAADLNVPGWDKETGAGLIDVKSAIDRALSIEPTRDEVKSDLQVSLFSGEGRVETLARAASEPTQKVIYELEKAQQDLLGQWQVLADLDNPSLSLSDLQAEAIAKIAEALNKYQQVSTDAGITDAHNQQRVEELALATSHYQIENDRLQNLLAQRKELEDKLAKLGKDKSALETETQKMLEAIQAQITKAETDLAKAQAKLLNPFANVGDNLQTDPAPWREAANKQQELASNFQEQAAIQNAEATRFSAISNSINPLRWQPVGSEKGRSGRRREIWGMANDPNLLKQKNQSQWQSQIATQNSQSLQQLSQQAAQQEGALNLYAQFLEARPTNLGEEGLDKAGKVLQLLQQQAAQQAKIAENYTNLAAIAASRQQQNQTQANWHNSQINRREQVGTRRTGRSGKNTEPVYGNVYYPEHIGPRDMAQQLADQAASESQAYAQLAQQAQQQASALQEQAIKLETGIKDWPVLKQGIDYEIAADALRLQAEQDLLDLHDPVQRQKLETLLQEINLAEKELQRLENEKIPAQQQLTDIIENRLKESQAKLEAIQAEKAEAAKNLQNFLETAGFLLPYRERLLAVDKQIEKLESEQLDAFKTMLELQNQLQKNPSDSLQQQLDNWSNYLQNLEQELAWAKLQRDQLAMALADSPERLAIASLIQQLETAPASINPPAKIAFLKSIEGSGASFLAGFDNLNNRLTQGKTEQAETEKTLTALQQEYRELGLKKADLEDVQIPAKQKQIVDKDKEIEGTESAIAQTTSSLSTVAAAQLTDIPSAIASTDATIQQQKSAVQGYQNQISQAFAAANSLEQQRQANQNAANYWNGQIYVFNADAYLAYYPDVAKAFGWNQKLAYQHYLSYGRYEGRLPNPQAAIYRNNHQAAANSFAQQRDLASSNAQQLNASLQPQIATAQQQIDTLETDKNLLVQLSQLNAQLSQQQQQRDTLVKDLEKLNQEKADTEQKLIDKYREIELTSQYLEQVEAEVDRLQSRLDVLNRTGVLQTKYQQDWNAWQQANQTQVTATQSLLATRQAGAADRQQLADLQSQLKPAQENLQKGRSIETSLADTQQALAFTNLQIGNQNLVIQSAIDNDAGLAAAERYQLNLADASRQKTWYWNGSAWAYNAGEAAAYRNHLQAASFIADERNKLWQRRQDAGKKINELTQKAAEQQSQIASLNSQLQALGGMSQLEAEFNAVQSAIASVNQRLQPLQNRENQLIKTIQNAASQAANLAGELAQTTQLKSTALRQLIGLGMLASESDVDFFATQVEPQVNTHLEKLRGQGQDLTNQINSINELVADWEQQLANTTDPVSQEYLKNLIQLSKSQLSSLEALQASSQTAADDLEQLLKQATEALLPLRQKQELEIRQKLESNENRLNALQSQLNSENAAEAAIKDDTVLAHAQLTDQVRQDLTNSVNNTTQDLLEGNPMTKKLGDNQQNLSESVDTLIAEINSQFADPYGAYQRSEANLEDGIKTLGVVENLADTLDGSVTSTEEAIEKIKLRIKQDEELWQEIAPIAMRYGVESQELKDYQAQIEAILGSKTSQTEIDAATKELRAQFLQNHPENGTAINLLQGATLEGRSPNQHISNLLNSTVDTLLAADAVEGRNPNQALFDKAKAEQASHEAQGYAALAQADWLEQRAAYHWSVSRKNGPYWYEQRWVKRRCGKGHWETVTHVDHDWIVWNNYSKLFPHLRQQGIAHLAEADKWRKEKERIEPLAKQWTEANNAANQAQPPVTEARNFFAQLEEAHKSIPSDKIQLELLENLLPTLKQQLEQAEAEAAAQNAKVQQEWEEYDTNSEEYRAAVADILARRGELNKQAIETQQEIADVEKWVERQSVALAPELAGTKALIDSLEQQQQAIANQITEFVNQGVTVDGLQDLYSKEAQLKQTLQLLTNKAAILTAQQTALTQKRTLLTAQNEVILAEQRLLDAYTKDPDADTSNLQQQLQDARAALAEAQRLAEQAEAASKILTAPLQQLKEDLLVQNDEHLKQARENQNILKALVEATQANANYTIQAAQKQQEVNNFEFQILQRLQQATDAGFKEAKALLDVAKNNDMATAAEIYYRDYNDLASDRGSKSSPGLAQPQDRILADRYYQEMLNNRELQRRARSQADAFGAARKTAEAQIKTLQAQQETAAKLLSDLNDKIATTQEEKEKKEQELAIAQARLDGITRIREQTEQTFSQLVAIEKLNLAQAQLEQEIAESRQQGIDEAVQARMERDRLETARQRTETVAKIEQLRQLQAEDNLRQSLNQARGNLGMTTLEATDDPVQLQTQLAGLLASLKDLETQQQSDLPADLKVLLAEARGDIHEALQGKEAANIQENLLKAMDGLIGQIDLHKTEINRIDLEEQWDTQLLQTAQTDLQGASQQLLKELQRAEELSGEKQVIEPLYMDALTKVAYAEQAVRISEDFAKQSKEMLEQIIKQRVAERKARKKAFWNKILGIVSTVLSLVGAVLTFVPGANLVGLALGAIGGAINVVQAAINGDWMGAIFSAVMAGANFVGGAIGNGIKAGQAMVMGMTKAVAQKVFSTIKAFQSLASGAFNGVRNLLSGDKIMGFLQIMGGLAGAATSGISGFVQGGLSGLSDIGKFGYKVLESLSKAPTLIYGGIKAIQSGDWVSGIGNIIKGVVSLGKTWTNDFNDGSESPGEKIANILENISSVGIGVSKFITGGLEGLLAGLGDILDGLGDDIQKWVENLLAGGNCECLSPEENEKALEVEAKKILNEVVEKISQSNLTLEQQEKAFIEALAERLQQEDNPQLQAKVVEKLETTQQQAEVTRRLPLEQQQEVFHNLSGKTKTAWAKAALKPQLEKFQQTSEYQILAKELNALEKDYIPVEKTHSTEEQKLSDLQGFVTIDNSLSKKTIDFIWGVLQGEYNRDPSIKQIIAGVVLDSLPIIQDLRAVQGVSFYLKEFITNPEAIKDPWNWVGLIASGASLIPVAGGTLKRGLKIVEKAGKEGEDVVTAIRKVLGPEADETINLLLKYVPELTEKLGKISDKALSLLSDSSRKAEDLSTVVIVNGDGSLVKISPLSGLADTFEGLKPQLRDNIDQASNKLKGALTGFGLGSSLKSPIQTELLAELTQLGIKHTPENIVAISKQPNGKIVFLETGDSKAGLQHILKDHEADFVRKGIPKEQIPDTLMKAVTEGKIVDYQGKGTGRPIYELKIQGQTQHIAVTVSSNGYIVGANPTSIP